MKKILFKLGIAVAAIGALFGVGAGIASAASGAPAKPFPAHTALYYDYDKGYGVVVATSGVNASKTASFTIDVPGSQYGGPVTFSPQVNTPGNPTDNTAAFAGYLQTPDWVYGPTADSFVPSGYPHIAPPASTQDLTLLWSGKNGYTNNVETYVYQGTGLNSGVAPLVVDTLTGN